MEKPARRLRDLTDDEIRDMVREEAFRQEKERRELASFGGNAAARDLAKRRLAEMTSKRRKR
ncbi:hypothetical protein ACFQ08_00845 [Streptosporangium algeriense]|uniref:Uncharacterized protein n=1 Tax=Streptosporangium algeriense TaxID=1682748 RepID=A0ABW3DJY6_9ACTN